MVILNRIYTRTGDDGTTALGDFSRTSKNDPRLTAYADTDEANSAIGVALATGELSEEVRATLLRVQNDLFDVGADLCAPLRASYDHPPLRVQEEWIEELETDCDTYNEGLGKLRSFILPGGTAAALDLHLVGVDVVVGDAGPFVVDANPFPGYRSVDGAAESITGHLLSHL